MQKPIIKCDTCGMDDTQKPIPIVVPEKYATMRKEEK